MLWYTDKFLTYEEVHHAFEKWESKLSKKSFVLSHDVNVLEHNYGVWKFWEEIVPKFHSFIFSHGHELGIIDSGNQNPQDINKFLNSSDYTNIIQKSFINLGEPLFSKFSLYRFQSDNLQYNNNLNLNNHASHTLKQ